MAKRRSDELGKLFMKNLLKLKESEYEVSDKFLPAKNASEIHTLSELYDFAKRGEVEVDCSAIFFNKNNYTIKKLNTQKFIEAFEFKHNEAKLKESLDLFNYDDSVFTNRVGEDFIPMMGGAFNKQLYYRDYLRMHALCYHAWNHDPIAKRIVEMIHLFSLGKGFKIESDDKRLVNFYRIYNELTEFERLVNLISIESIIYGEIFLWELPSSQKYISFEFNKENTEKSIVSHYRLIDPSVIWEVVTTPDDIENVLGYWWVAPTQYQIKTEILGKKTQGSKFIAQEIPASQVIHFKRNVVSNEKRGRSDLFPILGYLKRLRDAVNYQIIADQKNAAWAIDTKIDGSQSDIDAYIQSMQELGDIPPAGSEFVHSAKITREYISNKGGGGISNSFEWVLSMIAIGSGIPISYLGSHLSGGQTRASALVSTEPSVKLFEEHQSFVGKIIKKSLSRLFKKYGIYSEFNVVFPELVTHDRTAKLRDLQLAQMSGWISKRRAAEIVAKELGIDNFNYDDEKNEIELELNSEGLKQNHTEDPLTSPSDIESSHLTSLQKKEIKDNERS